MMKSNAEGIKKSDKYRDQFARTTNQDQSHAYLGGFLGSTPPEMNPFLL